MKKQCIKIFSNTWFILVKNILIIIAILLGGAGADTWEILIVKAHEGKLDSFMVLLGLVYGGAFAGSTSFSYAGTNFDSLFELLIKHLILAIFNFGTGIMTIFIFIYLKVVLGSAMPILLVAVGALYFTIILHEIYDFYKAKNDFLKVNSK